MFYVPVENYPKLEKKFNKIKNKGGTLNLNKGDPVVMVVTDSGRADPSIQRGTPAWEELPKHKFYPIEVEGKYEVPGWKFVATIEHTPGENIIRNITDEKIPDKYRTISPECEHCHRIRDRKDTYLVKNTETGEFKQIGKSCLKGYTGGLDAAFAALMAQWVDDPEDIEGIGDDLIVPNGKVTNFFDPVKFKKIAYNYVKEHGYSKDPYYIGNIVDIYRGNPTSKDMATDSELSAVNEWVLNLDTTTNDYFRNAFIAWNLEDLEYRHLRLVTSLIHTYFKESEKEKQKEVTKSSESAPESSSSYVGNVGDKITLTVSNRRVLYRKTFQKGYRLGSVPVYKIIGTDNNVYIWSTDSWFDEGDTIVATVKSHSEFNGEKQTVITRGKVVDPATGKSLEQRYRDAKNEYHDLYDKLSNSVDQEDWRTVMEPFDYQAPNDALDEPTMSATKWYEEQIPLIKGAISDLNFDLNKLFLDEE